MTLAQIAPPTSWVGFFLTLCGALALAAFAAGLFFYNWRRGGRQADEESIATYKTLAESRKAKIDEQAEEIKALEARLQRASGELEAARAEHDECTRRVLNLLARQQNLEKCVNRLERAQGMKETDFDDPTIHATEGFGRR